MVYIDGGSPPLVRQYLEQQAARRGFQLVSTERYVAPNVARNLALDHVRTKYVAFVGNDVLVSPGWLERLVDCAESSDAWITSPVICQGESSAAHVRWAGGTAEIVESAGRRLLRVRNRHRGRLLGEVASRLVREPVGQADLHAVLIRTDVLARMGRFDERLPGGGEEIDLALLAREHGGAVFLEPGAVATYVPPPPFETYDLPYFKLRWSDSWNRASIARLAAKWRLAPADAGLSGLATALAEQRRLTLAPYRRWLRLLGSRSAEWIERSLIGPIERAVSRRRFPGVPPVAEDRWRRAA